MQHDRELWSLTTAEKRKLVISLFVWECLQSMQNLDAILLHWTHVRLRENGIGHVFMWLCTSLVTAKVDFQLLGGKVKIWDHGGLEFPIDILNSDAKHMHRLVLENWKLLFRTRIEESGVCHLQDSAVTAHDMDWIDEKLIVARWVAITLLLFRGDSRHEMSDLFTRAHLSLRQTIAKAKTEHRESRTNPLLKNEYNRKIRSILEFVESVLDESILLLLSRSWDPYCSSLPNFLCEQSLVSKYELIRKNK